MDAIARAFESRVGHLIPVRERGQGDPVDGGGVRIDLRARVERRREGHRGGLRDLHIPPPCSRTFPTTSRPRRSSHARNGMEFVEAVKVGFQAPAASGRRTRPSTAASRGPIGTSRRSGIRPMATNRPKGIVMGAYIWSKEPGLRFTAMASGGAPRGRGRTEGEQLHPGYGREMECGVSRLDGSRHRAQKGAWPRGYEPPEALPQARRGDPLRRRPGHRPARLAGGSGARRPCGGRGRPREGLSSREGAEIRWPGGAGLDDEVLAEHAKRSPTARSQRITMDQYRNFTAAVIGMNASSSRSGAPAPVADTERFA